jgi:pSer/pThr/pTyr-binding forkhead associated (FHA) protein
LDDQSRNGSFVNGQPVKRAALGQNVEVNVPPFRLAFELHIQDRRSGTLHRETREGLDARDAAPMGAGTILMSSPPRALARPVLRLIKGPGTLVAGTFPLSGDRMIIGRGARAEIRLDSTTVSRQHVELVRQRDGTWLAIDLKSANGMAVNGHRVMQHVLMAGDVLAIGPEIMLQFVVPEPGPLSGPADV